MKFFIDFDQNSGGQVEFLVLFCDEGSETKLKMAPGETIRRSYECSHLLSLFFCVKNDGSKD